MPRAILHEEHTMTPTYDEVVSLGVKTFGMPDEAKDSLDGIYELNGVSYVVSRNTVTPQSEAD